jgi:hypothetical protein
MKTILQALIDEIHYPITRGKAENVLLARGIYPEDETTLETFTDNAFIGAIADALVSLVYAVNFSEADTSISVSDKDKILELANRYYKTIGESDKCVGLPVVSVMSNY